jgi:hypothetical protein
MNCIICGQAGEIHHIVTRAAYGGDRLGFDQQINLVRLCRKHHDECHKGFKTFWNKYEMYEKYELAHKAYREYEKVKNGRE